MTGKLLAIALPVTGDARQQHIGGLGREVMRRQQRMQANKVGFCGRRLASGHRETGGILEHGRKTQVFVACASLDARNSARHQIQRFVRAPDTAQHHRQIGARARHGDGVFPKQRRAQRTRALRVPNTVIDAAGAETGLRQIAQYERERVMRGNLTGHVDQLGGGRKGVGSVGPSSSGSVREAASVIVAPVIAPGARVRHESEHCERWTPREGDRHRKMPVE